MNKLIKKIRISVPMKLITGMRIGDSKENVEIGGVDNPVIRRRDNNQPYVPGSSLKGKMRSLLELVAGENADSTSQQHSGSFICQLFGSGDNTSELNKIKSKAEKGELTPQEATSLTESWEGRKSRLIVRDAYLTKESVDKLLNSEFTDMPYTEIKMENVINRVKGAAEHPRQMERVPPGAAFQVNMIINVFERDNESKMYQQVMSSMKLLETDYLGSSGSRGYGQVEFDFSKMEKTEISTADYLVATL